MLKIICYSMVVLLVVSCQTSYISPDLSGNIDNGMREGKYIGQNFNKLKSILPNKYKYIKLHKSAFKGKYNQEYLKEQLGYKFFEGNGELAKIYRERYITQLNDIFYNKEVINYENISDYSIYIYPMGIYHDPLVGVNDESIYLFLLKGDVLLRATKMFPKYPWYSKVPQKANALYLRIQNFPSFVTGEDLSENNVFSNSKKSSKKRTEWYWGTP